MRPSITLALALAVSASGTALAQNALFRAVHASPDAPNVDVRVNGSIPPGLSNVPFTAASNYLSVPAASYNVQVTPANLASPVVINANLNLAADTTYTVAAMNTLANIQPVVFVDDNTLDPSAARIRFIHASPNTPTVQIGVAGTSTILFDNVSFTQSGGYISVPGGSYNLDVRVPSLGLTIALPTLSVNNNSVYTVWAMGLFGGTGAQALGPVVTVDAIPSPGAGALLALAGLAAARRRRH